MKNLGRMGRCIYCGKYSACLSDEHIVPEGLNGEWILGSASCPDCQKIINKFETDVLRRALLSSRVKLGFRSKHGGREWPKTFRHVVEIAGKKIVLDVPIQDHFTLMMLPIFPPPAYLEGRHHQRGIDLIGNQVVQVGGPSLQEFSSKYKSIATSVTYKPTAFGCFLAKIGYGFAVAHFGLDRVFPAAYVLAAILDKRDDIGRWVGCSNEVVITKADSLHVVRVSLTDGDIVARVKLFAQLDVPEYLVVAKLLRG